MDLLEQRLSRHASRTSRIGLACVSSLLLLFLAAGCARFGRRQFPPEPTAANFDRHALANPGLKHFVEQQLRKPLEEWPLHEWDYPRLTLAAWYFQRQFQEARTQWQRAEAELAAARGQPESAKPDADGFSTESLPVPFAIIAPEADVVRPHAELLAGQPTKRTLRIAKAQRSSESARFHLAAVAWQMRASVRTNVMAYVATQRGEALLEELETAYVKLIQSAEPRVTTGSMPHLELSLLRLQLAQVRLVLIRTRLEKMDSRERLADSLALPVNALFDVEVEYDFSRGANRWWTVQELRRQALHCRPDVSIALIDYAAAEAAVRVESAKKRPHLPLPAGCRWDSEGNRWIVSLNLWLPAEHRSKRTVARAESRRIAAAARLITLQAVVIDEVERSAAVYRVTEKEVAGIDALVAAILRQYALTKEHVESGIAEPHELLLARLHVMAAAFAKLEAQVKLQNALGSLENAMCNSRLSRSATPVPFEIHHHQPILDKKDITYENAPHCGPVRMADPAPGAGRRLHFH